MTQLDDVLALATAMVGGDLLGAYLHGSSVAGGLRPRSDLDVLLVTRRPLETAQRRELVTGLLPMSGHGRREPADRPVELVSVARDDVVPWRYPPVLDLLYGEWEREHYEAGELPQRGPSPDLAVLLTAARATGRALVGPPPAVLLDPVPAADLRRAIVAGIPGLLEDLADDTTNVLLTLARIRFTLETGRIVPKDAAADWVLARLPPEQQPVMAHARAIYLGEADGRWEGALREGVRPCADALLAGITDGAASRAGCRPG